MDSRLEHLLKNTPNVYGNSIVVMLVRLISLVLGLTLIIIGISMVISPFFQFSIVDFILEDDIMYLEESVKSQIERLTFIVGWVAIVVGSILMVLRHFAGYVLIRNGYIMDLRDWYADELAKREDAASEKKG